MKTHRKISILMAALALSIGAFGQQLKPGTAQLGDVWSNQPVVTQEVDSVFTSWTNGNSVAFKADTNNFWIGGTKLSDILRGVGRETDPIFNTFKQSTMSISVGKDSEAWNKSVAIGIPFYTGSGNFLVDFEAGTGERYYWRSDYFGNVEAARESVAIGDSAQAKNPVSVAIGDQAIVGSLHREWGIIQPLTFDKMVVSTRIKNGVTTVTTNVMPDAVTNEYEIGMYERLPSRASTWKRIETTGQVVSGGETNIVDTYVQNESGGVLDISYLDETEFEYYNRIISGGQGKVPFLEAYYGVAVGSRSYVFGYHSVAYGHYAHASRPCAVAIGSESHVYSEGSQALGYDTDIPNSSPYSLALGMNASIPAGMTNAIVIGVPQVVDFTNLAYRTASGEIRDRPKAVKSNSINFAYHGNGIQDFFLDGVSLQDRLASEVKVVGNTKNGTNANAVDRSIREIGNIPDDEEPLVFYSGDGGIYFFTKEYEEDSEANIGDISKIFINGKPLSEIIGGSSSHDADFAAYKTSVSNAAEVAINAINVSTNMTDVKSALTNFFNTIKQ